MRDPSAAIYRTKEEVEKEKQRDPIDLFRAYCAKEGILTDGEIKAVEEEVNKLVDEAVAFAEASPEPPTEWLLADIYKA